MTTWIQALLTFVGMAGIVQALILAAALAGRRDGAARGRWALVAVLAVTAASLGAVVASHRTAIEPRGLEGIEYAAWLSTGPLVYLFFLLSALPDSREAAIGRRPSRLFALHLLPAAGYCAHALASAAGGVASPMLEAWRPPVVALMAHQAIYTALAIRIHLRSRGGPDADPGRRWRSLAVGFLLAMHGAQLARLTWSGVPALRDLVPAVAGVAFLLFTAAGLRSSRLLAPVADPGLAMELPRILPPPRAVDRARVRPAPPASPDDAATPLERSGLTAERARDVGERLRRALDDERLYLDVDLTARALAAHVAVPRAHLSLVLRRQYGRGFLDEINARRIAEARRLLADPSCAGLTIEAIAHRSGFRSRSTFYDVFRRLEGRSPASLRPGESDRRSD